MLINFFALFFNFFGLSPSYNNKIFLFPPGLVVVLGDGLMVGIFNGLILNFGLCVLLLNIVTF